MSPLHDPVFVENFWLGRALLKVYHSFDKILFCLLIAVFNHH